MVTPIRGGALLLACLLVACVESATARCETPAGVRWCQTNAVCTPVGCATSEELDACRGQPDRQPCATAAVPQGQCFSQVCVLSQCGDGLVAHGEACDDGNTVDGDGCAANCASTEQCGNGVLDAGEACDDGNLQDLDACHGNCQPPRCGDRVVDTHFGEACDDGNTRDGDGCAATCRSNEECGNGVRDALVGEACDDGNIRDGDGCAGNCRSTESCGNGAVDAAAGEVCDDGNAISGDGCAANCRSHETCGNGVQDVGEACDEGAANGNAAAGRCRGDCTIPRCGDGLLDAGEACDAGAANSNQPGACRPNCTAPRCGDAIVDPQERCDDGNFVVGDGCSANCRSDETCGNGIVDATTAAGGEQCDDGTPERARDGCAAQCVLETLMWQGDPVLTPRSAAAAAYDRERAALIMVGGVSEAGRLRELWQYRELGWSTLAAATRPPAMSDHFMAYDSARKRVVLLGMAAGQMTTWEFDGAAWQAPSLRTQPTPRTDALMVYDEQRQRTVLFGGGGEYGDLGDTWSYDGTAWTLVPTALSPSPRTALKGAYDRERGRIVLFGGVSGGEAMADTWEFGTTWTQLRPQLSPGPLAMIGMAYDERRRVSVVAGADEAGALQTWEWNGSTWQARATVHAPPVRDVAVMAYVVALGRVVLFGGANDLGELADTWLYDGVDWVASGEGNGPPAAGAPTLVYDHTHRVALMFGGAGRSAPLAGTWLHDAQGWHAATSALSPSPRFGHAMAYDRERGRMVLYGGAPDYYDSPRLVDTWEFDGVAWALRVVAGPTARQEHAMAYDTDTRRVVLFGGVESALSNNYYNDHWEFDGALWRRRALAVRPPPRARHAMVYDEARHVMVLFGGSTGVKVLGDTWEFDGSAWRQLTLESSPGPRERHALTYDPERREVILVGGINEDGYQTDVWRFDGVAWRQARPSTELPRGPVAAAYNPWLRQVDAVVVDPHSLVPRVWRLGLQAASAAPDACISTTIDSDGDGRAGCGTASVAADPDCWQICTPTCRPETTATVANATLGWPAACDVAFPDAAACGDGICDGEETYLVCPVDCPAP